MGGNTGGDALGSRNQYGFDDFVVKQFDRIFYRPIAAVLHQVHSDMVDGKVVFEQLPGGKGDIAHVVEVFEGLVPKPLIDLLGPEFFLSVCHKKLLQISQTEFPDVLFLIFHKAKLGIERLKNFKIEKLL